MKENTVKVTLVLNNGDQLNGFVNMIEYKRFSDFIETHPCQHINLFNATIEDSSSTSIANFVVVPKKNILYYMPFDEESVKKIEL
jgi:hypothetical protein